MTGDSPKGERVLTLDNYEYGVMVNALNEFRNDLIEEEPPPTPWTICSSRPLTPPPRSRNGATEERRDEGPERSSERHRLMHCNDCPLSMGGLIGRPFSYPGALGSTEGIS